MEKRILLILLIVCALCSSCRDDSPEQQSEELFEVGYRFESRTDTGGAPENKDTYTIISYRQSTLDGSTTGIAPDAVTTENQRGYYAYLTSAHTEFVDEDVLVPVKAEHTDTNNALRNNLTSLYPYVPVINNSNAIRNNDYGQKLQEGIYKTAIIYPAATLINSTISAFGSYLVVLPRNADCLIYSSKPDGLFDMEVRRNLTTYDININHAGHDEQHSESTDHKLYVTLAMMRAYFYSPPDVNYKIESVKLLNVGTSGWYNPYTGITYINYGSDERVFTLTDNQIIASPVNWRISRLKASDGEEGLPFIGVDAFGNTGVVSTEDAAYKTYPVHYLMDNEAIYAADYRSDTEGGTMYQYVKTITMRITVNIDGLSDPVVTDIPVSLDIKSGKLYNFYFDIRSGVFSVKYGVSDWEPGSDDEGEDMEIGETVELGRFDFEGSGTWIPGNADTGDMEIGNVTP